MSQNPTLLPCAHCGGLTRFKDEGLRAQCSNCGTRTAKMALPFLAAATVWNSRAPNTAAPQGGQIIDDGQEYAPLPELMHLARSLAKRLKEAERLVQLLADLAITESEIEQEFKYGPRIIFEKGGKIAVRDVLMARMFLSPTKPPPQAGPVSTSTVKMPSEFSTPHSTTKDLMQHSDAEPAAGGPLQGRIHNWMLACFGETIAADKTERCHRFLEESLELVQTTGTTASEAHQLVDYVFNRPVGEPHQEIGGVVVTLSALCSAVGDDMLRAGEDELARVWTKIEAIRAKQAAKPKHSPLPAAGGFSEEEDLSGPRQDFERQVYAATDAEDRRAGGSSDTPPHVPAAFINAIAEEGSKAEAIEYLQKEWNENCQLRRSLARTRELLKLVVDSTADNETWHVGRQLVADIRRELETKP